METNPKEKKEKREGKQERVPFNIYLFLRWKGGERSKSEGRERHKRPQFYHHDGFPEHRVPGGGKKKKEKKKGQ